MTRVYTEDTDDAAEAQAHCLKALLERFRGASTVGVIFLSLDKALLLFKGRRMASLAVTLL